MTNDPSAIYGNVKTLHLSFGGQQIWFTYPDAGNMTTLVKKILAGEEYRLFQLPDYSPRQILDVGANVGATALFFALAYPTSRIRCYEPSPQNFTFLVRNIACFPHIEALPFGLAEASGEARLFIGNFQAMQNSLFRSVETTGQYETIQLRSARDELGQIEPDTILKLDTEGCEVPILQGISDQLRQLDMIYLEYHSEADRRMIESILAVDFVLASSHSTFPHRGSNHYIARRLLARFPQLNSFRIER